MTATRLIRIDCDGTLCRVVPTTVAALFGDDENSIGTLGGGYVSVPHASIEKVRQTINARDGWQYDRATKRDLCPRCAAVTDSQPSPVPLGAGLGAA